MKKISSFLLFTSLCIQLMAQKPFIDSQAIVDWPIMNDPVISNDGSYFLYSLFKQSASQGELIVQSTTGPWKKELAGITDASFSGDNKKAIFKRNDTLFFLSLGNDQLDFVPDISTYEHIANDRWLLYRKNSNNKDLLLRDLLENKELNLIDVDSYAIDNNGATLALKKFTTHGNARIETLNLINLENGRITEIPLELTPTDSFKIVSYSFDVTGKQLAFIIQQKAKSQTTNSLWYYKTSMNKALMMTNDQSVQIEQGLSISNAKPFFDMSGEYIFFYIGDKHTYNRKPNKNASKVDVWSYKDSVLQMSKPAGEPSKREYLSVTNIMDKRVNRLEKEDEVSSLLTINKIKRDFVVILDHISIKDYWWDTFKQKSAYLVSLKDGARRFLRPDTVFTTYLFSPGGKYLLYFDKIEQSYFSYNLSTRKLSNVTQSLQTRLTNENQMDSLRNIYPNAVGIAGWLSNDESVLIYDNYDIWKVSLSNNYPPVNITNHYGRLNHIKFRVLNEDDAATYSEKDTLLLVAFNILNKQNGIYLTTLNGKGNPDSLMMASILMYIKDTQAEISYQMQPVKARHADKWIVRKESPTDAPNYFLTSDFKSYKRLTDLQPQKKYNWLSTELISWKQIDGTVSQGILYKPENFDPQKKYPVLLYYYEKMSHGLNKFPQPDFANSCINIPWFVSRGYLVVSPDIHYYVGKTGECVYNSVVSVAEYLSKIPWVDSTKIGITGHSFGGYETNYLVTHTGIFAAAASGSGITDLISDYGGILKDFNQTIPLRYESYQLRMGFSLWERPDLYIDNSPIFNLDKVTTPLLIMHNREDEFSSWAQSVELFIGLRRLRKKVWLLQYDEGKHGVIKVNDQIDYTIRLTQFFDHYLKNAPPPKWMIGNISANSKEMQKRNELNSSEREP